MLKVIVVDDEPRICRLIIHLIDWEEHGMEVVGIANNGIDAVDLIKNVDPQIVITDIRMPGYSGLELIEKAKEINENLEFIIISGYEEFSYAQKAIGYEVRDYLCKPIKAEALLSALKRSSDAILSRSRQKDLEKEAESRQQDLERIRTSFLQDLLFTERELNSYDLEEINSTYHFHFKTGTFRAISIKIDHSQHSRLVSTRLVDDLKQQIVEELAELSYELASVQKDSRLDILLNYNVSQIKELEFKLKRLVTEFKNRLLPYRKMITIGYGSDVTEFEQVVSSFKQARQAIDERILLGTGKIITSLSSEGKINWQQDCYYDFLKKFTSAIELLDISGINNSLNSLHHKIKQLQQEPNKLSGSALKRLAKEIVETYYVTLRKHKLEAGDSPEGQKALEREIDNSYSIDSLFQILNDGFNNSIRLSLTSESQKDSQQIRQAKAYISENYMEKLTLEDLGNHLGFNPTYFSSLFKKETDVSFLDYVVQVRMEKAKELLKEPDLKIQDVSLMVGYNDVRYFRRLFLESTGLRPNEYRKLFS